MKHEEGGREWSSIITREAYLEHCLEVISQDLIMLEIDIEDSYKSKKGESSDE
ncbi:hypothetical protein [Geomicrobium sp. JCM 19055]|uniref:hypothetical protein n=1 Tax=Geomicrobium sp. JCM 19055 TaxID=1460649 RepID=UPI00187C64A4|nr:hypothetical protein [Geomicrobium sp. JCM 19055]